ncbi:MAG: hypothetical protein ACRYGG_01915 [Janthinobacterium lividum]
MILDPKITQARANPEEYQRAVFEQTDAWVQGTSMHNRVNGECCPDFSCCHPDMKMPLEERRAYFLKYMEQKGIIQ